MLDATTCHDTTISLTLLAQSTPATQDTRFYIRQPAHLQNDAVLALALLLGELELGEGDRLDGDLAGALVDHAAVGAGRCAVWRRRGERMHAWVGGS